MLNHKTTLFSEDQPPQTHRTCLHCEYDLHAHTETNTCPECGTPFDPHAPIIDVVLNNKNNRRITLTLLATPAIVVGLFFLTSAIRKTTASPTLLYLNNTLYTLTFFALPAVALLAAARNIQIFYIGNAKPSAFKRMPHRAIKSTLLLALAFLIAQSIIAGLLILIIAAIYQTLTSTP